MSKAELDKIDRALIEILQVDATTLRQEILDELLSRKISTTLSQISRKITALVANGHIKVKATIPAPRQLGYPFRYLTFVTIKNPADARGNTTAQLRDFENRINTNFPSVVESQKLTGPYTYVLKILARSDEHFDEIIMGLNSIPNVSTLSYPIIGEHLKPLLFDGSFAE